MEEELYTIAKRKERITKTMEIMKSIIEQEGEIDIARMAAIVSTKIGVSLSKAREYVIQLALVNSGIFRLEKGVISLVK